MNLSISSLLCLALLSTAPNAASLNVQPPVIVRPAALVLRMQERQSGQASRFEQEVRQLERAWLDAYEQLNVEAMQRIVADDFMITFPDGSMQSKAQIVESLKRARAAARPMPKFHTEDVRARVYGETVILTGRVVTEYQRGGETVKDESRYTDTYVKRQGRWQVVASHLSNVAQPPQR